MTAGHASKAVSEAPTDHPGTIESIVTNPIASLQPVPEDKTLLEFKVYPHRWHILWAFFSINYMQCVTQVALSAFANQIANDWPNVTAGEATLATSIGLAVFMPAYLLSAYLYNNTSLWFVQFLAALVTLVGGWIRLVAIFDNNNFWWVVIGQGIVAVGSPLCVGGISIIANQWFGDEERAKATALMTISNPIGLFTGFAFAMGFSTYITDLGNQGHTTAEALEIGIYWMIFVQTLMITVAFIYFMIVFRSEPPSPPSTVACRNHDSITQGMVQDFKTMLTNKNFLWILLAYSLVFCIYSGMGIILSWLYAPFPWCTATRTSELAMAFVLVGAYFCFFWGKYLDRTNQY